MLLKRLFIVLLIISTHFLHVDSLFAEKNEVEEFFCRGFGYIVLNNKDKTIYIVKKSDETEEILSQCYLKKIHKNYLVAESVWPGWKCVNNIEINVLNKAEGDSINVSFKFNQSYENFTLIISNVYDNTEFKSRINDKNINCKLKKNSREYSIAIQPDINPFSNNSSWGNNRTMGVLMLLGVSFDVKNNNLEILIHDFNPNIFKLWYLDNEIILKGKNVLFWDNKYFFKNSLINNTSSE